MPEVQRGNTPPFEIWFQKYWRQQIETRIDNAERDLNLVLDKHPEGIDISQLYEEANPDGKHWDTSVRSAFLLRIAPGCDYTRDRKIVRFPPIKK